MTSKVLLDQLVALHAAHDAAHRRMVAALEADDLLALVDASRQQGALCTEQGSLLADYVATAVAAMPGIDPEYRNRVITLADQLRADHGESQARRAGG
jgi:hypothetical protein